MKDDPIVQKVREIRDAYAAEFNYDLKALYEDIKRQEQANQKPHHRLTPKRIACFSVVPGEVGEANESVSFCVGFGNCLPECFAPTDQGASIAPLHPTPYTPHTPISR